MVSVCRPQPDKMIHWFPFPAAVFGCRYADPDADDMNSHDVFQLVQFLSEYGCANTDTDTETWKSDRTFLVEKWPSRILAQIKCKQTVCVVKVIGFSFAVTSKNNINKRQTASDKNIIFRLIRISLKFQINCNNSVIYVLWENNFFLPKMAEVFRLVSNTHEQSVLLGQFRLIGDWRCSPLSDVFRLTYEMALTCRCDVTCVPYLPKSPGSIE